MSVNFFSSCTSISWQLTHMHERGLSFKSNFKAIIYITLLETVKGKMGRLKRNAKDNIHLFLWQIHIAIRLLADIHVNMMWSMFSKHGQNCTNSYLLNGTPFTWDVHITWKAIVKKWFSRRRNNLYYLLKDPVFGCIWIFLNLPNTRPIYILGYPIIRFSEPDTWFTWIQNGSGQVIGYQLF